MKLRSHRASSVGLDRDAGRGPRVGPWDGWPRPARGYAVLCVAGRRGRPADGDRRPAGRRTAPAGIAGRSRTVDLTDSIPQARADRHGPGLVLAPPAGQRVLPARPDRMGGRPRPGCPSALDGLRILHLTDLHLTPAYSDRFFEAMLEQVAGIEADLVVFTGDLIDDARPARPRRPAPRRGSGAGSASSRSSATTTTATDRRSARPRRCASAGFEVIEGRWATVRGRRRPRSPSAAPRRPGARCPTRPRSPRPTSGSCSATRPTRSAGRPDGGSTWCSPATPTAASTACRSSARSSCRAATAAATTAASSAAARPCCTSAAGSAPSTRSGVNCPAEVSLLHACDPRPAGAVPADPRPRDRDRSRAIAPDRPGVKVRCRPDGCRCTTRTARRRAPRARPTTSGRAGPASTSGCPRPRCSRS